MTNITYWHPMPENVSTMGDFLVWANTSTNDSLGKLFLITAFVISFISLKLFGFSKALATSSFTSFTFSLLLWSIGLVSFTWVIMFIILTIMSTLMLKSDSEKFGI